MMYSALRMISVQPSECKKSRLTSNVYNHNLGRRVLLTLSLLFVVDNACFTSFISWAERDLSVQASECERTNLDR